MENNKEIKVITVVSLCLIAVFTSFMAVYAKTLQRTADDLVKIRTADARNVCDQMGGHWTFETDGVNGGCKKN